MKEIVSYPYKIVLEKGDEIITVGTNDEAVQKTIDNNIWLQKQISQGNTVKTFYRVK